MWLKRDGPKTETEKNFLSLKLYAELEDGIPLWLHTQVELTVAGKNRGGRVITGLWTLTNSQWAFPDRLAKMQMAVQDNPTFAAVPAVSYNFYPSTCYYSQGGLVFYENWTDYQADNQNASNAARLFDTQAEYTLFGSASHRGCVQGWSNGPVGPVLIVGNDYYTTYATVMLAHARRRGLSGAGAAYTALVAAQDVLGALLSRPGFYQGVP